MSGHYDVAIVGAGVAGLAAARALDGSGLHVVVLEAAARIGGRAHTVAIGAATFDRGASWLHAAERNPLTPIARAAGVSLRRSDADAAWRLRVGERAATQAERDAHDRLEARYAEAVEAALAVGRDLPMADAAAALADDPWLGSVETFACRLIAAADPRLLSARDWRDNELDGSNLLPDGGLGAMVARCLGRADVRLGTAVSRIDWANGVALHTPAGVVRARAAIVTVSTGALPELSWSPGLPDAQRAALDALPMGLLTKVAVLDPRGARFGLPEGGGLSGQIVPRHAGAMSFLGDRGRHLVGFVGGETAEALAREGEAATAAFAVAQLRSLLGQSIAVGEVIVADWAADPYARGAYAYTRVGHAAARHALGTPWAGGRMVLAGEAVAGDGLAGTVGGAYASGAAAAEIVRAALA